MKKGARKASDSSDIMNNGILANQGENSLRVPGEDLSFNFTAFWKKNLELHLHGTRHWIFEDIHNWIESIGTGKALEKVYWVTGDAGIGKTIISSKLLEILKVKRSLGGWHFCRHNNPAQSNVIAMLDSLSGMLRSVLPAYAEILSSENFSISEKARSAKDPVALFKTLFQLPLNKMKKPPKPIILIIDGLDEMQNSDLDDFLILLRDYIAKLPSWLGLFLTSRRYEKIFNALTSKLKPKELQITERRQKRDVSTFMYHIARKHADANFSWNELEQKTTTKFNLDKACLKGKLDPLQRHVQKLKLAYKEVIEGERLKDTKFDEIAQSFPRIAADKKDLRQKGKHLDEIYAQAKQVQYILGELLKIKWGDKAIVPRVLKEREKAEKKIRNKYANDSSRIRDVSRFRLVFSSIQQLKEAFDELKAMDAFEIISLKNKFLDPDILGYSNISLNLLYKLPDGSSHICELELHLDEFLKAKEISHHLNENIRSEIPRLVKGADSEIVDQIVEFLIGELHTPRFESIADILVSKAGGLFLYAQLLEQQLIAIQEKNPDEKINYHGLLSLPPGLSMMYLENMRRIIPENTSKSLIDECFIFISIVCSAKELVPIKIVEQIMGKESFNRVKGRLSLLFPCGIDGRINVMHKSASNWFTDKTMTQHEYFISAEQLKQAHVMLARFGLQAMFEARKSKNDAPTEENYNFCNGAEPMENDPITGDDGNHEGKRSNLDDDCVSGNTGNKTRHRKWGLGRSFRRTSSKKNTNVRSDSGLSIGRAHLNDAENDTQIVSNDMRDKVTLTRMNNYDKIVFDYIWKHTVSHACAGGEKEQLDRIRNVSMLNFDWLRNKVEILGPHEAMVDAACFCKTCPDDRAVYLIMRAIQLSLPALYKDSREFASQMAGGRLDMPYEETPIPEIISLQEEAMDYCPKHSHIGSGVVTNDVVHWMPVKSCLLPAGDPCLLTLSGEWGKVYCVRMNKNGDAVWSCSDDRMVRFWNMKQGRCTLVMKGHAKLVVCLDVSDDESIVYSGSEDKTIRSWDAQNGAALKVFKGHKRGVVAVRISRDGKVLFSSDTEINDSGQSAIHIWDSTTAMRLKCISTLSVRTLEINLDASLIFTGHAEGVHVWNTASEACVRTLSVGECVLSLCMSGDGECLYSSGSGSSKVWNANTGELIKTFAFSDSADSICVSGDGTQMASAGGKAIRIWNANTGDCTNRLEGHSEHVTSVSTNGNGTLICSGSKDGTIRMWDGTGATKPLEGHQYDVIWVQFNKEGTKLLTVYGHNSDHFDFEDEARVWDTDTGKCVYYNTESCGVEPGDDRTVLPPPSDLFDTSAARARCWDDQMSTSFGGTDIKVSFDPGQEKWLHFYENEEGRRTKACCIQGNKVHILRGVSIKLANKETHK